MTDSRHQLINLLNSHDLTPSVCWSDYNKAIKAWRNLKTLESNRTELYFFMRQGEEVTIPQPMPSDFPNKEC